MNFGTAALCSLRAEATAEGTFSDKTAGASASTRLAQTWYENSGKTAGASASARLAQKHVQPFSGKTFYKTFAGGVAAVLAGIPYGTSNQSGPPPVTVGNAHGQHEATLVNNLRDALRELGQSAVMADYLGSRFLDVFVACKEHELNEFEMTISDLEYLWYLHTV